MVKRQGPKSKVSLADRLIEEALKVVEKEETESGDDEKSELGEITISPEEPAGPIQIDLKKYIDREAYLRLLAEFENFRKRSLKDREAFELSGKERILRGFLEILDNFERGISQAADDSSALATGMRMILSQAEHWLNSEGLIRIETHGAKFDPQSHEAISQVDDDQVEAGFIVEEIRRGYRWRDRLLRPAAVVVSKGTKQ